MSFNDLARKRYSCRKLAAKPVEQKKLDATAQGLGAVWTAAYPHEDRIAAVRGILSIPERYVPLCVVPVGFPADPSAKPKDKWKPGRIHREKF